MKVDENPLGFTKSMFRSNCVGILVVLWMIGLAMDDGIGTFIHILYAAALAVLAVCLGQEVIINRKLRQAFRHCSPQDGNSDRWGRQTLKGPSPPQRR
jgi:hypothetical protein